MTAANAFIAGESAYLLTDTAWFDSDNGRIAAFASKSVHSERLLIAAAETGSDCHTLTAKSAGSPIAAVHRLLTEASTQDEALHAIPRVCEAAFEDLKRSGRDPIFRVLIACCRIAHRRPQVYLLCSPQFRSFACRPFTLMSWNNINTPDIPIAPDWSGDVRSEAVRLIEGQRREAWDDGSGYKVGGSGVLTTVSEAGIREEEIVRWRDRVGDKIAPDGRRFFGVLKR